jgi:hypothetical protein
MNYQNDIEYSERISRGKGLQTSTGCAQVLITVICRLQNYGCSYSCYNGKQSKTGVWNPDVMYGIYGDHTSACDVSHSTSLSVFHSLLLHASSADSNYESMMPVKEIRTSPCRATKHLTPAVFSPGTRILDVQWIWWCGPHNIRYRNVSCNHQGSFTRGALFTFSQIHKTMWGIPHSATIGELLKAVGDPQAYTEWRQH